MVSASGFINYDNTVLTKVISGISEQGNNAKNATHLFSPVISAHVQLHSLLV